MQLTLPEAIRIGAARRPQAFGRFFELLDQSAEPGSHCASCALGAAYEARYGLPAKIGGIEIAPTLRDAFPMLRDETFNLFCPVPHCENQSAFDVQSLIFHLNDGHQLTREQIADELEKLGVQ